MKKTAITIAMLATAAAHAQSFCTSTYCMYQGADQPPAWAYANQTTAPAVVQMTDVSRGLAAGLAASSVPIPSMQPGQNFVGFGAGNVDGNGGAALVFARQLTPGAVVKITATTQKGFGIGAGFSF